MGISLQDGSLKHIEAACVCQRDIRHAYLPAILQFQHRISVGKSRKPCSLLNLRYVPLQFRSRTSGSILMLLVFSVLYCTLCDTVYPVDIRKEGIVALLEIYLRHKQESHSKAYGKA